MTGAVRAWRAVLESGVLLLVSPPPESVQSDSVCLGYWHCLPPGLPWRNSQLVPSHSRVMFPEAVTTAIRQVSSLLWTQGFGLCPSRSLISIISQLQARAHELEI